MDEKVSDLACRRQEALQVACVVAGETEASRRDDGCFELQTLFHTDREGKTGRTKGEDTSPTKSPNVRKRL